MSGVGDAHAKAITQSNIVSSRLYRIFVVASATTLLALAAALGLNAQQVETEQEKPGTELAMASVSINTPVTLRVSNHNWLDARIYAVYAGTRYRLGTVGTAQTQHLELPRVLQAHIQAVQILTLPIGSTRGYLSPEIHAEPGDIIAFEVEENLNLSSIYVAGNAFSNK